MSSDIDNRKLILRAIGQLQQLAALFSRRRSQIATGAGVTEAQWRILEGVATEHFMPSMFAQGQDNTRGAVSKITKVLLQKELISVAISPRDGRQRQYELTTKGRRKLDRLRELRETAIEKIWADIDANELKSFVNFNDQLIERIRSFSEKGGSTS